MKAGPYKQRYNGDWIEIAAEGHKIACCDCSLVHLVKARVRKGRVEIVTWRDNRATANRRRGKRLLLLGDLA